MIAKQAFLFIVFVGIVRAQSGVEDLLKSATLPPDVGIENKLNEEIQNKTLSNFKMRCDKNGGPEAYNKSEQAYKHFAECISKLVVPKDLQLEIENAKPNGTVDEVFQKYCNKRPLFEKCVRNLTNTAKNCFTVEEHKNIDVLYNMSRQLSDFVCFKDGERIALFIAEGGQECVQEKQNEMRQCINETLGIMDPNKIDELIGDIKFDQKQCQQLYDLQTCVTDVLAACDKPTTSNIFESLLKYVRKITPCKEYAPLPRSAAYSFHVTSATLVMALVSTLIL